jgi:hypothetical protein
VTIIKLQCAPNPEMPDAPWSLCLSVEGYNTREYFSRSDIHNALLSAYDWWCDLAPHGGVEFVSDVMDTTDMRDFMWDRQCGL